jgi:hypothetical protein
VVPIDNKTVFIREANIADASHTYNIVKIDGLGELEVSYISPTIYGKIVSPTAGTLSSFEGQVRTPPRQTFPGSTKEIIT